MTYLWIQIYNALDFLENSVIQPVLYEFIID